MGGKVSYTVEFCETWVTQPKNALAGQTPESYLKSPEAETLARTFQKTTGLHKLVTALKGRLLGLLLW